LFFHLAAAQKEVDEEDVAAEETELTLATLRNEVMEQVAVPYHPIVVCARNICQFVHEKKLGSLNIVRSSNQSVTNKTQSLLPAYCERKASSN